MADLSYLKPATWVEPFISDYFLIFLSSLHYILMSDIDYSRLLQANTTSPLYNFSRALNLSENPLDSHYKNEFQYFGYPSDTFSVHFMRKSPIFVFAM